MLTKTLTGAVRGVDGYLVRVEVHLAAGLPAFRTVGLPDAAVREARERVRAALEVSGFPFPNRRITLNLAPAHVPKHGTGFDLAAAVGIVAAQDPRLPAARLERTLLLGELALGGELRPVRGVLAVVAEARREGLRAAVVARANEREAALVDGIDVYPVASLAEAVGLLAAPSLPAPSRRVDEASPDDEELADLADVRGQLAARRALEIAAAGGHNLLLVGPPGAGKTLLARRMPSLLPPLALDEALEVTRIHSVAGRLAEGAGLLRHPPFRAPHHTSSAPALVGGGPGPLPGEISLAHRGVLFLDELAEFPRRVLEALRQPLEEGAIVIGRANGLVRFPARFVLVGAMNPCPCGWMGSEARPCRCPPGAIGRYQARVSGPLLDRIDLCVFLRALSPDELVAAPRGEPSRAVRARVVAARARQAARWGRARAVPLNGAMTPRDVARHCRLGAAERRLVREAARTWGLTARGLDRALKVARTVADLEGAEHVRARHLHEALHYRPRSVDPSAER